MKLKRLVELIQENGKEAEEWPVLFSAVQQNSAGEWHEVEGVRRPITSVEIEESAEEVLFITALDRPPLLLKTLIEALAQWMADYSEFTVDQCETPAVLEGGGTFHIDVPIISAGCHKQSRCYLIVCASENSHLG